VRIAFLGNGLTGYLNAQYRKLHELKHDLLVVQPGRQDVAVASQRDTAFELDVQSYATYVPWQVMPTPSELVPQVLKFEPDAVVMSSWNFSKAYRAVMRSVDPSVVRILVMDNLWRATPRQWLGRLTHRWYIDPVADAAMVPSGKTEFYARRLGFGAADVIRGSLSADLDLFAVPERSGEELASRRSFLFVGRLVQHKGPDLLARAYRRYRELVENPWDLHVVGIGPLEPLLRDLPGVVMHGFRQPPEVAELMRTASCFVLPSHIEPYGVVVHEAAAAGLPILCSDFAGAAHAMVQDGQNGWIVPAGNVELWARAFARMSSLDARRLASMSSIGRAMSLRISPRGWAVNLQEEIERRRAAGGGRLG
jgi:glycosyltransferase involved in cell wall biosynthesis